MIVSLTELSRQPILIAIPLFTYAGYVLSESKTPERLINLTQGFLGFLPGGLAIVALFTCALFTAFTGASGVTIIALGGLLYPVLIKEKYPEKFSLGLMTTSGSLGLLFPPSLPIILYGIVSKTDISELFLGALIPGALLMLILVIYAVRTGILADVPRTEHPLTTWETISDRLKQSNTWVQFALVCGLFIIQNLSFLDEFIQFTVLIIASFLALKWCVSLFFKTHVVDAFNEAKWEVFLPILIVAGIYSGQFTATESAAVTAIYVLIIEVFVYKDISITKDLPRITRESMVLVGAILMIMAVALALTNYLVDEEIPDMILGGMKTYIDDKILFLIALNIFLLIVGSIMDIFSAILVVVPLIVPLAIEYDVHPVHLGVIFLANLEIGYMTPPVGLNLFISSFRFDKNIVTLYKSALPYIGLLLLALALITYIPELSLILL